MESSIHSICGVLGNATFLLADEKKGGFNPLDVGDWQLYFWTAIVFAILVSLLTKFVWGPLMKVVADREQRIADDQFGTLLTRNTVEIAFVEIG